MHIPMKRTPAPMASTPVHDELRHGLLPHPEARAEPSRAHDRRAQGPATGHQCQTTKRRGVRTGPPQRHLMDRHRRDGIECQPRSAWIWNLRAFSEVTRKWTAEVGDSPTRDWPLSRHAHEVLRFPPR